MTAYNLSVVFAPTLMRSPSEDMSLVKDITLQRHFVEMLILKHNILFNWWHLTWLYTLYIYTSYFMWFVFVVSCCVDHVTSHYVDCISVCIYIPLLNHVTLYKFAIVYHVTLLHVVHMYCQLRPHWISCTCTESCACAQKRGKKETAVLHALCNTKWRTSKAICIKIVYSFSVEVCCSVVMKHQ